MRETVWITGAGSGIGKALALEFAANNIPVVVSGRNDEKLDEVKKIISKSCGICEIERMNVSSSEDVFNSYKNISSKFKIDCLINNAGVTRFKSAEDHSIEEIDSIISTNLLGSIYATKSVLPDMIKSDSGTIINILSVAANKIFTNSSVYAASKAGLAAFANGLREELKTTGIRVINVFPGATKTGMWQNEMMEKYGERMMKPEDIAKHICKIYLTKDSVVTEEITFRPLKGDL